MTPEAILETCLYAGDLRAAEAFYGNVLGLELVTREPGRHAFFRCGRGMLLIFNPAATSDASTQSPIPRHGATGPGHVCFRVAGTALADWQSRLAEKGVAIEAVHTWPNGARSIYFRDPAGNSVELGEARLWGLD